MTPETTNTLLVIATIVSTIVAAISAKIAHSARRDYQKSADKTEIEKLRDKQEVHAVELGKLQTEIVNLKEKTTDLFSSIKEGDVKINDFVSQVHSYMVSQASKSDKTNQ